jgi:alpha,alpha-trehalase
VPGGYYEQQWDWDGFFICLYLAGRRPPQPEYFRYWALNFLGYADSSGYCPGCVRADGPDPALPDIFLKPFVAQGAGLAVRLGGDHAWLEPHYDTLVKMVAWRDEQRRDRETGLYFWNVAMESGADNNPAVGNDPAAGRLTLACDASTLACREYRALAALAETLGHTADAGRFGARGEEIALAVRTHLWDDATESFWNRRADTGEFIRRVSYSNFVPLWAGLAPGPAGRAMIQRYLWNESHMLTRFGLRSLSRCDPDYNNANVIEPYSNWQGPVWPIANYFYFVALERYGFPEEAGELVARLTDLYLADIAWCGSLHENYDAETGKPLAPSAAQSATGTEGGFVGWNLLLQDMIEVVRGEKNHLCLLRELQ